MDFRNPYNPYGFPPQLYGGMGQAQGAQVPTMGVIPQAQGTPMALNRVTGMDGARMFACPPNSVVPLFDDTRDVFYIKTTDSGGFPTIKAFAFAPLEDTPAMPQASMSREEIQGMIREEVARYGQQFISAGNAANVPGGTAVAKRGRHGAPAEGDDAGAEP